MYLIDQLILLLGLKVILFVFDYLGLHLAKRVLPGVDVKLSDKVGRWEVDVVEARGFA